MHAFCSHLDLEEFTQFKQDCACIGILHRVLKNISNVRKRSKGARVEQSDLIG